MIDYLRECLYRIYCAIFPYFISLEAELRPEPDPNSLGVRFYNKRREFLEKHPTLARIKAHIYLDYYMPIFRPVFWWRHITAINQPLDDIGWEDRPPSEGNHERERRET